MKETNAILAGEMSGHMFFKDRYYGFDDAIYAGCRMIDIVRKNKLKNSNFKIENLLDECVRRNASDLHIQFGLPPILRIDGALVPIAGLPALTDEM